MPPDLPSAEPPLEPESQRRLRAYYAATRWPALERTTFVLALLPAVLEALRSFDFSLTNRGSEGTWLLVIRWLTFVPFVVLDSFLITTRHPIPIRFGPYHPRRIYEKFLFQNRAWQLLLVLFLPITARLIGLLFYIPSAR